MDTSCLFSFISGLNCTSTLFVLFQQLFCLFCFHLISGDIMFVSLVEYQELFCFVLFQKPTFLF